MTKENGRNRRPRNQKNIYLANTEPSVAAEIDAEEDQLGQMMS